MGHQPRGGQQQVMQVVHDHLQDGSAAPIDAITIAQQLGRPPAETARYLRRCAREGLVLVQEYVGQDNPSVVRLTYLGQQWLQQRVGPGAPSLSLEDPHLPL